MKNIFLIITLATLVLISGCKAANAETESAEFSSQISSSVSGSKIAEFETKSETAQESSSELSATVAQGYESVNEVNSKPTAQSQEIKTESSAAEIKPSVGEANNIPQASVGNEKDNFDSTLSGGSGNAIKNATAADTRKVADKVIFYLNKARAEIGSGELAVVLGALVLSLLYALINTTVMPKVTEKVTSMFAYTA